MTKKDEQLVPGAPAVLNKFIAQKPKQLFVEELNTDIYYGLCIKLYNV